MPENLERTPEEKLLISEILNTISNNESYSPMVTQYREDLAFLNNQNENENLSNGKIKNSLTDNQSSFIENIQTGNNSDKNENENEFDLASLSSDTDNKLSNDELSLINDLGDLGNLDNSIDNSKDEFYDLNETSKNETSNAPSSEKPSRAPVDIEKFKNDLINLDNLIKDDFEDLSNFDLDSSTKNNNSKIENLDKPQRGEAQIVETQMGEPDLGETQIGEPLIEAQKSELLKDNLTNFDNLDVPNLGEPNMDTPPDMGGLDMVETQMGEPDLGETQKSELLKDNLTNFDNLDMPNLGEPNLDTPNMDTPDFGTPDFGTPDFSEPNMGVPDFGTPDFSKAGMGEAQMGEPDLGETQKSNSANDNLTNFDNLDMPNLGEPNMDTPDFGTSDFSEPNLDTTNMYTPDFSESNVGVPDLGESQIGETQMGEPDLGETQKSELLKDNLTNFDNLEMSDMDTPNMDAPVMGEAPKSDLENDNLTNFDNLEMPDMDTPNIDMPDFGEPHKGETQMGEPLIEAQKSDSANDNLTNFDNLEMSDMDTPDFGTPDFGEPGMGEARMGEPLIEAQENNLTNNNLTSFDKNATQDFGTPSDEEKSSALKDFGDLTTPEKYTPPPEINYKDLNKFSNINEKSKNFFDTPSVNIGEQSFQKSFDLDDVGINEKSNKTSDLEEEISLTNQEIASVRNAIGNFTPDSRKIIIDNVVNEKLETKDSRQLVKMLVSGASEAKVLNFIKNKTGAEFSKISKDGLEVIYTDELDPIAIAKRKRKNRFLFLIFGSAISSILLLFSYNLVNRYFNVQKLYNNGLAELHKAANSYNPKEREESKTRADYYYKEALAQDDNKVDLEYLKKYGMAYLKARYYTDSFAKLFGISNPPYNNFQNWKEIPYIKKLDKNGWLDKSSGVGTIFTDQTGLIRKVVVPGAYIIDRLKDDSFNKDTMLALAKFHSYNGNDFVNNTNYVWKNDILAIDYYNVILKLMNKPNDIDALVGIGDIYYNQKNYIKAMKEFSKLTQRLPNEALPHAKLLETYLKISELNSDPRIVLAKHRELKRREMEDKFPLYLLAKLANFYIKLSGDDVLIKYQVNPIDTATNQNLVDSAKSLLDKIYYKKEKQDLEIVNGKEYAEGLYVRGLYMLKQKDKQRAVKNFEEALYYDPMHFLAMNAIGEYYRSVNDFEKAAQYFTKSLELQKEFIKFAGRRPEDETLIEGDIGKIYYNTASIIYLRYAGFENNQKNEVNSKSLYPISTQKTDTADISERRRRLDLAKDYFEKALENKIKDEKANAQTLYSLGWIEYMNGNFGEALKHFEGLDSYYQNEDINLKFAKANSYYFLNQPKNALTNYLEIEQEMLSNNKNSKIKKFSLNSKRDNIFSNLYNNIGATYELEANNLKEGTGTGTDTIEENQKVKEALTNYWKAVEYTNKNKNKFDIQDSIPRANLQLAFKSKEKRIPLLEDSLNPLLFLLDEY